MASILSEVVLDVAAEKAWAMLRDAGAVKRAFPGVLVESKLEGSIRTVTFANGTIVKEQIIDIDDAKMRIAYAVIEGRFSHHSASMQLIAQGATQSRFVWISDLLPDEAAPLVRSLVEQGTSAFKSALQAVHNSLI